MTVEEKPRKVQAQAQLFLLLYCLSHVSVRLSIGQEKYNKNVEDTLNQEQVYKRKRKKVISLYYEREHIGFQ